jgi:Rod binding domain-containing protein
MTRIASPGLPLAPSAERREPSAAGIAERTAAQQDAALRRSASQLEGVFVAQLFQAMRATVPDDGVIQSGQGESMFRDMLDARIAERAPAQWSGPHSLGDALYRQLRTQLDAGGETPAPAPQSPSAPLPPTSRTGQEPQ